VGGDCLLSRSWEFFEMADSSATKRSRIDDDDEVTPSSKRYRNSEWPLPSTATPKRPSRFQEGSMNDRISKKPPTPFIEQERPLSTITNHSDAPRQSGIFKFGRSITAGFNPANWKIWSKTQPVVRDEKTEQQRLWDVQKEMADRKYEESVNSFRYMLSYKKQHQQSYTFSKCANC
jgi:hypothetical protein